MRRFAILALIVVIVAGLAAAALPLIVSTDLFRNRIADQIALLTGRQATISGEPSLSVYPHLTVTVGDVTIANPAGFNDAPFVAAESVAARLQLLPLLIGRTAFDAFDLTGARIHLIVDADGRPNWTMPNGAVAAEATGSEGDTGVAPATRIQLGQLTVAGATIVYDDLATDRHEELTDVAFDTSWPNTAAPATASGRATWRGETIEFNASVDAPRNLIAGSSSATRFAIASTQLRASFNGQALMLDGLQLEGQGSVTTPSLRSAIGWLGTPMGTGAILGAAAVSGSVNWVGGAVSFSDATVELDGNSAEGVISANFAGDRPTIQGTLAMSRLDLSPYLEAARADLISEGSWLVAPTRLPVATTLNADLRISTDEILLGSARIGKAAVSIAAKDDGITVNVGEAQFYGGTLAARVATQITDGLLSGNAQIKLTAVPAGVALADFTTISVLNGTASADLTVAAAGQNWGEFVRNIAGTADIEIVDGMVTGVDVGVLASEAQDPLADQLTLGTGSTAFDRLTGTLAISEGRLLARDVAVTGEDFEAGLTGGGSLVSGLIDAQASLSMRSGSTSRTPLQLLIGGTWRDPTIRVAPHQRSEDPDPLTVDLPG